MVLVIPIYHGNVPFTNYRGFTAVILKLPKKALVFLALRHFLFRLRVFPRALGSVARREPARTPCTSLGRGRGPCTCSGGSKSHVPSGRHSEHIEPSRPLQTRVQVKWCPTARLRYLGSCMSSISSDVTYLEMETFFPDTNAPDMRPRFYNKIKLHDLGRILYISSHAYDPSMVGPFHLRPTTVLS